MNYSLISVIIPTFNRGHLLGQTLESIISQEYKYWECIVVDDGSNDYTSELMEFYCQRDYRIQYHHRPDHKLKGANACRNYGFQISKGEFINWFDSDDLMFPNNLKSKIIGFESELDFVVGNSLNFTEDNIEFNRPFALDYSKPISVESFLNFDIGWITNDVLIRKRSIPISFNENLKSGQEYNFFVRYLHFTTKGKFLKKDLAYRRVHPNSIQCKLLNNNITRIRQLLYNEIQLIYDLKELASNDNLKRSMRRILRLSYEIRTSNKIKSLDFDLIKVLFEFNYFISLFYYVLWLLINLISGKGYFALKKALKKLDE
ncbi:glycosyltransferase family 2 protein [Zunongwangia atlantica]|uniref:Family 2 glycosyl transferase n=1 Tax=Zunongwangia atlantica 22II14-10F7 TaxID=1185767 RepID=A0A1Y1T8N5_9FLAO|nr:glycosyltransferase family 2 protein [Zunongwangia atlantica]ORL47421.1 family 2 glycosyl transferase [Zunongwangia atlantica 22II14-10F7]